jgi:transcriptional regulator with XRE-family HTH domain
MARLVRVSTIQSFGGLLGARLAVRRTEQGLTQDELARKLRSIASLDWSRAVVAAIETGRRELTLPELALLLAILDTNLGDILKDAGTIELVPGREVVDAEDLVAGLCGRQKLGEVITVHPTIARALAKAYEALRAERKAIWPKATQAQVIHAEQAMGEADAKAARSLGVTPRQVTLAAHRLWGRSLTEERDARVLDRISDRASARTRQALRGHVTRTLIDELRPVVAGGRQHR